MTSRSRMRRPLALAAGLALVATLAACGSGSQSKSSSHPQRPQSIKELTAAAAKEGSLTLYTTMAGDDVQKLTDAFEKQYPQVKVNALRLSADQLPPRIITEQRGGKHNADVAMGDSPQVAQLIGAGTMQPYDPPDEATLPSGLQLPDGYRGVVYALTTVIAYNPTVLKQKGLPVPKSWQDLTKPEWKGQFSMDPSSVNWYDSLVESMGHDQAQALVKKLGNNSPQLVSGHTLALTQVQAGEPVASLAAYGYKAQSIERTAPGSMAFVNINPLPTSLNLIDLVKDAPHPDAAKLFMDWMVSRSGQQAIVQLTGQTSIRGDVKNSPMVWNPTTWKPAWGHANIPADTYNTYVQELKNALHSD